jgi:hypothetical protein
MVSERCPIIIDIFRRVKLTDEAELQYIQQTFGPPSQYIYAAAIAPYVGLPDGDNVPGLTLDQLFADLNQNLNDSII